MRLHFGSCKCCECMGASCHRESLCHMSFLLAQSFKLNVDSHCSLKDGVLEEGKQLLEVIISHKSGSVLRNPAHSLLMSTLTY